ncbi:MAG TPA: hypothetical protein VN581_07615 [Patescibacteria group bacterium]|nr:hypothetical protein [Patescibacteria group bacterium]
MLAALAMLLVVQSLAFALPMARTSAAGVHAAAAKPATTATPPCHRTAEPTPTMPSMPCCDEDGQTLRCCDGACTCVGLTLVDLSRATPLAAQAPPDLRSDGGGIDAPVPERIPPLPPPIPA